MSALLAVTLALTLRYDAALTAAGFPSPVVDVVVGNQRAVFLIDTGASVHTFARWFVDAAKLKPQPTDRTVTGSTGTETRLDVVTNVSATLAAGRRLLIPLAIVADFPPLFKDQRIAGVLSPQLFAQAGEEAVLDLRRPRLSFQRAGKQSPKPAPVCINAESPFRNRLYATAVTIASTEASLLLDTGATRTTINIDSALAQSIRGGARDGGANRGVGGAVDRLLLVPDVAVIRGDASRVMDVRLGTIRNACGPDGLLGMSTLR